MPPRLVALRPLRRTPGVRRRRGARDEDGRRVAAGIRVQLDARQRRRRRRGLSSAAATRRRRRLHQRAVSVRLHAQARRPYVLGRVQPQRPHRRRQPRHRNAQYAVPARRRTLQHGCVRRPLVAVPVADADSRRVLRAARVVGQRAAPGKIQTPHARRRVEVELQVVAFGARRRAAAPRLADEPAGDAAKGGAACGGGGGGRGAGGRRAAGAA